MSENLDQNQQVDLSDPVLRSWLEYAREVVTDDDHRQACEGLGGSSSLAVIIERASERDAGFAADVRWPGYVGRDYQAGGVLWVSNIHRNFDSGGLSSSFAAEANRSIRDWRDDKTDDARFVEAIRSTYERGLRSWTVGGWPGKALFALGVPIESIAYTNVAKCQALDTGVALQKFCVRRWSLRHLVEILQPGLVLLTSATGLASSGSESWPCDVVGFSQRNGRLLNESPWRPPTGEVSFKNWIKVLRSEWSTDR